VQHFHIQYDTPCKMFGVASDSSELPQKESRRELQE